MPSTLVTSMLIVLGGAEELVVVGLSVAGFRFGQGPLVGGFLAGGAHRDADLSVTVRVSAERLVGHGKSDGPQGKNSAFHAASRRSFRV